MTSSQQNSTVNVNIGQRPTGGFQTNGRIDDVRVYSSALSAAQIQTDMTTPVGGAGPPPVSADLSITKTDSPDPVVVGGTLGYTLTVSNAGPSNATSVIATDTLPASVTFVSASAGCVNAAGTVTCTIGGLNAAQSVTRTITVTAPSTSGTISNTASVTGSESDPNPANNSASATTQVQAAAPACSSSSAVWLTGMEHGVVSTAGGGIFSTLTGTPTADNAVFRNGAYSLRIADAQRWLDRARSCARSQRRASSSPDLPSA